MPGIVICGSILSRVRCRFRRRYLRKRYAGKPPKLYCDLRYRTYISPEKLIQRALRDRAGWTG